MKTLAAREGGRRIELPRMVGGALAMVFVPVLAVHAGSVRAQPGIGSSHIGPCIPATELAIGGIHIGDDRVSVIALLGEPKATSSNPDLRLETLVYEALRIEFWGSSVLMVHATRDSVTSPSGVRLGMSRAAARKALGLESVPGGVPDAGENVQVTSCGGDGAGGMFVMDFGDDDRIEALRVGNDLP